MPRSAVPFARARHSAAFVRKRAASIMATPLSDGHPGQFVLGLVEILLKCRVPDWPRPIGTRAKFEG